MINSQWAYKSLYEQTVRDEDDTGGIFQYVAKFAIPRGLIEVSFHQVYNTEGFNI